MAAKKKPTRGANQTGGGYIRKYEAAKKKAVPEIKRVYTDSMGQGNPDDFRAYVAGKYLGDNAGYRLQQRERKRAKQINAKTEKDIKVMRGNRAKVAKGKK